MRSRWHKFRSNLLLGLTRSPHSNERFRSPKLQKTNPETRDTLIGMLSSCRVPFYICGSTRPLPPPRNLANSVDKRPESCTTDCTRFRRFGSRRTNRPTGMLSSVPQKRLHVNAPKFFFAPTTTTTRWR